MHCSNCGAVVEDWYKFCRECGCCLSNNTTDSTIVHNNNELTSISPNELSSETTKINLTQVLEPNKASAWQRLFARCTDLTFELLFAAFLVSNVLVICGCYAYIPQPVVVIVGDILVISTALLLDALIYKICGNTLGKKIFSIKILDFKNNPLTTTSYLKRNFSILPFCYFYWVGHALPVPGIYWWIYILELALPWASLIGAVWQYQKIEKGEETSYDHKSEYHVFYVKHTKHKSFFAHIFFFTLLSVWIYIQFFAALVNR